MIAVHFYSIITTYVSMKKPILRSLTATLWAWLVVYTGFLYSQGATIAQSPELQTSWFAVWLFAWLYLIAIIIFSKRFLPTNRYTLALVGIALILFPQLYLIDDPTSQVYLRDIMTLIGVFIAIVWPTKMLVTKKLEEQKMEDGAEIIEV